MNILITGSAGFIGYHLSKKLLKNNHKVYGLDNLNSYYDVKLKKSRINLLKEFKNFIFFKIDICKTNQLDKIIKKYKIKYIIHLAAQAGVRYSITNPDIYFKNNVEGFFNIMELARTNNIKHLLFASSSSVYGNKNRFPISEDSSTDFPLSFYGATKKSNEVMAYSYSAIFKIPMTSLRFFTVYGPFGRPDMSLFKFTKNIIEGKKIDLFNNGNHIRDFSYIDDVVNGIELIINKPAKEKIPYNCFNIGNSKPQKLKSYLKEIEKNIRKKAKIRSKPLQRGDVVKTHSDIKKIKKYANYNPTTNIGVGIKNFVQWYKNYFNITN